MAEETQSGETSQASTKEAQTTETTLEDVYKTHNVDQMAQEFQARPRQQETRTEQPRREETQETEVSAPDPTLDPKGYQAYESRKSKDLASLRQALSQVTGQLTQFQRAAVQQVEEADIRKAVESVNEHLGDAKLDPDVVEISLGAEARKDKRFLTIWQNRNSNPRAFQEAMKAFSGKLAKKFAMRADPQIAENQRALREATSTKATTSPEQTQDERLGKLQGAAFTSAMNKIKQGMSPF